MGQSQEPVTSVNQKLFMHVFSKRIGSFFVLLGFKPELFEWKQIFSTMDVFD